MKLKHRSHVLWWIFYLLLLFCKMKKRKRKMKKKKKIFMLFCGPCLDTMYFLAREKEAQKEGLWVTFKISLVWSFITTESANVEVEEDPSSFTRNEGNKVPRSARTSQDHMSNLKEARVRRVHILNESRQLWIVGG